MSTQIVNMTLLTVSVAMPDEEVVAKLAELDIVVMDLERSNAKVVEAQSKNEMLKKEIAKLKTQKSETTK
jgi:hypothetical protein